MKVLIVCSGNSPDFVFEKKMAFVYDQMQAVKKLDENVRFELFLVQGKGIKGYLRQRGALEEKIKKENPNIIHTHGGHIGIVTLFQGVPNVITFHGSEINNPTLRKLSNIILNLATYSILVSEKLSKQVTKLRRNTSVIPCGVDLDIFQPIDSDEAKKKLGIEKNEKYILFSSAFDVEVKNFPLAKEVMQDFPQYAIREIKDKSREEVNLLINGAEALIMTSFTEGSPQITKEALACNQRIVSVNVGDVEEQLSGVDACFVCDADKKQLSAMLRTALSLPKPQKGRIKAENYDNKFIAKKIYDIYLKLCKK